MLRAPHLEKFEKEKGEKGMGTRNKPRNTRSRMRLDWIVFAIVASFLASLVGLAPLIMGASYTSQETPAPREPVVVLQNIQLPPIAYSLSGMDVNVFGNDAYSDEEMTNMTGQGAYPMQRDDYRGALALSGTGWLELHCLDDNLDNEVIILASDPRHIERSPIMPTISCINGWILPKFRTGEKPDFIFTK